MVLQDKPPEAHSVKLIYKLQVVWIYQAEILAFDFVHWKKIVCFLYLSPPEANSIKANYKL